jgi:hypothetical protein
MTSLLEQAYVDLITEREIKQLDFLLKSVYAASVAGGLTDEATERLQRVVDKRRAEAKLQPRRRLSLIVDNVRPYVNLAPAAVVPPALPENTCEHCASLIPCEAADCRLK